MKFIPLGKSDISISAIVMGTWQAGKAMWTRIDDSAIQKALVAAFDSGITTFDTAPAYGNGYSEQMVAKALGLMRQEVIYATKVFPNNLAKEALINSCHQSLRDLKTDYIDLFQIHWPAGSFKTKAVPVAESLEAMTQLKKEGKIRALGVSNFSADQLQEALEYAQIDSIQPPYSLFWRQFEADAGKVSQEQQVTTLAYSPMAQGVLTGKFGPDHQFDKKDHRAKQRLFDPKLWPTVQSALDELKPIAEKYGATSGQLALAWVLSRPNSAAIAGARNAKQVGQNAAAAQFELEEDDLAEMDRISTLVTDRLDEDPVMWAF